MFIEERHRAILAIIAEKGSITTGEIQSEFGIGYDSAKRDLRILEEKGLLKRTHGGAIPVGELAIGRPRAARVSHSASPSHAAIAKCAIGMIEKNDTILLASDEIGIAIAKELPRDFGLHVATNSIAVAEELRRRDDIGAIMIGGEIRGGFCRDGFAADQLRRMRFDKAFLTTDGISTDFGLSIKETAAISFWNAVLQASRRVIGVYPADILGVDASISIGGTERLDGIVTDADKAQTSPFDGIVKIMGVD